jgi:hypothetical protein
MNKINVSNNKDYQIIRYNTQNIEASTNYQDKEFQDTKRKKERPIIPKRV